MDNRSYQFDDFLIDTARRLLLRDGQPVQLTPKAFDTLLFLIRRSGQVVQKDELMSALWPDTFVEEGSLTRNIYLLRKALGDNTAEHRYIMTVPGKGYRFVAEVRDCPVEGEIRVTERLRTTIVVSEDDDAPLARIADEPDTGAGRLALPGHRPNRKPLVIAGLLILAGVAFGVYKMAGRQTTGPMPSPSQRMAISDLTTTGNVTGAAISPDGNYVAYAIADKPELSSLHLLQLDTSSTQMIIPPAATSYEAVTFSPDSRYVYYITPQIRVGARALYRVPILGGPSKKVVEDIDGFSVSFSPDGSQFVFRRSIDERRESVLIVAGADGTGEREVAAKRYPDVFAEPAWSPDGKRIACAAGHVHGGESMYLVDVSVGDWTLKPLSSQRWRWIGQLGWLADSSGLFAVAAEGPAEPFQVWHLSYPGGLPRRITNDPNFYNRLSISADSRKLLVLRRRLVSNVWLVPGDDPARAKQLTFGTGGYRGRLSWTPDGRLAYDSYAGSAATISVMNGDGGSPRQLTGEMTGRAYVNYTTVSNDGRQIAFVSDLTGIRHIWRMDIDGGNPVQLTDGTGEDHPDISPDGKWVIYTRMERGEFDRPTLWKISVEGGEPIQLNNDFTAYPAVSPDGKLVACLYSPDLNSRWRMAVYPIDGGKAFTTFPKVVHGTPYIRWMPDGRGLTYAENAPGASRIWVQPLAGGAPTKLVEFDSDRLLGFDWSRDGKTLACVRGVWTMDAVLIRGMTEGE